jgi:hypothetical protein
MDAVEKAATIDWATVAEETSRADAAQLKSGKKL